MIRQMSQAEYREKVADSAWWLFRHCGSRIQTLRPLSGGAIISLFESNRDAHVRQSERRAPVADAALWLHMNCASATQEWLLGKRAGVIVKVCGECMLHGERNPGPERKYTIEDLRKAYALAWDGSDRGRNGETMRFPEDSASWMSERDELLRSIK